MRLGKTIFFKISSPLPFSHKIGVGFEQLFNIKEIIGKRNFRRSVANITLYFKKFISIYPRLLNGAKGNPP